MSLALVSQKIQKSFSQFQSLRPNKVSDLKYRHAKFFRDVSAASNEETFQLLGTSNDGLFPEQIQEKILENGPNEIGRDEALSWQHQLIKGFLNPFIILLSVLGTISFATNDIKGAVVMGAMVLISVALTFVQEFRSSQASERLNAMVSTRVTVTRRVAQLARRCEIVITGLVPGDLVHLSAGDMIPGDLKLISARDLFISQSALTGESIPLEKFAARDTSNAEILDLKNICFMGTNVVSGTATGVVIKTGVESYIGSIAKSIVGQRVETNFDRGIQKYTWLMLKFMAVMVPLVFLINGLMKGNWFDATMFAIAVAVGLTPEMLPMIVTVNLAKGAMAMAKKRVIVKRLNSIQNFGAMDTLCTDKTGTLTQDNVILLKYVSSDGSKNEDVLKYAFLNSHYQTGLKNLLDIAVLKHTDEKLAKDLALDHKKVDEIPFDFVRRRMSVIVEQKTGGHILICKGALEEILNICTKAESESGVVPINSEVRKHCESIAKELNQDGLRVIAVAYKEAPSIHYHYSTKDEGELILVGFIAFLDPPKDTAKQAIIALHQRGVKIKVLTGDNDVVTRKICHEVGLDVTHILLGQDIEKMNDIELSEAAQVTTVFAKLNPSQKHRIVVALHRKGHVVGFLGDGINDAPALRAADVGISVDNAVDIAKESADIILLEKNLLVLEEGVVEGRKVFGNILKYIKMGSSSNFGNVLSVLGASSIFPFLPMQPVQLLTQNLLYDLSQTAIPFDDVDKEYLESPRKWDIKDIGRFMFFMGPISSLFDYAIFGVMWYVFKASTVEKASLFQSGWFVEGLLSQTLIVHMVRTRKIPFIQSRASWPLLFMTSLIILVGVYIPFSAFGINLGLVPLPLEYFYWLAAILASYCILTQLVKNWFIHRFGYN